MILDLKKYIFEVNMEAIKQITFIIIICNFIAMLTLLAFLHNLRKEEKGDNLHI